ncbi:hypothetical protein [Vibrio harveyi]|uniref:hypothetical protein n=1 Tax=Vibrio harveyi TaxID=669 RepID=UPI000681CC52|nr:hypothetical protein [Vibrio harveyi]
MNLEHDTLVQLITTISIVAALPWFYSIFKLLGRALVYIFYPVTTIVIEIEDDDGSVHSREIKVSNTDDLARAILKAKKVVSHD